MSQWGPQGYGGPPGYYMQPAAPAGMWMCPYCRTTAHPIDQTKITSTGWILFVVLLICCFPLCWIGLTMRECHRRCSVCGTHLSTV